MILGAPDENDASVAERARMATLADVETLSEPELRQAVRDLRAFVAILQGKPKPAKHAAPPMAEPVLGLPPPGDIERMQTPDGIVRDVVRVGYRIHHLPEVELDPCKCGARFATPEESMVALARKRQQLTPAICHNCGSLIIGEKKLVEVASSLTELQ